MKKNNLILLVFMVVFLSACTLSQRPAYEKNHSLWEAQAIQHYRFKLEIGCNCPWHDMMPLSVEVQNGETVSMAASNGEDITPYMDTFGSHGTIESLFRTVDSSISMFIYRLEVQYDATHGFPVSIILEPYRAMTDDAIGYKVTDFEVLP
jgi:hypothetical protein